jgi:hypothetical protein
MGRSIRRSAQITNKFCACFTRSVALTQPSFDGKSLQARSSHGPLRCYPLSLLRKRSPRWGLVETSPLGKLDR